MRNLKVVKRIVKKSKMMSIYYVRDEVSHTIIKHLSFIFLCRLARMFCNNNLAVWCICSWVFFTFCFQSFFCPYLTWKIEICRTVVWSFNTGNQGSKEITHQLRKLAILPSFWLSSAPSTHIWCITPACNSSLIGSDRHPLLVFTDILRF